MGKRYKSVIDLVDDIIDDEEFKEELKKDLKDKSLAHKLFGMRCAASITQAEMAKLMACDQSRISKLENAGLDSIKVGDLLAYTKALGLKLSIRFREGEVAKESPIFEIKTPRDEEESKESPRKTVFIPVPLVYNYDNSTQNIPRFNKRGTSFNGMTKRNWAYQEEIK